MQQRPLALDPEQLAAAGDAFEDERLGRAGDEVGDDCVDREPPAGDRDPGLAGRDERPRRCRDAAPRGRARGDGHLPDRAVGADGEHDLAP